MSDAAPPLSEHSYIQAARTFRHTLDAAARGDIGARKALVEAAAAPQLRVALARLQLAADKCAPKLDEIRLQSYGADAHELRFACDAATDPLSAAAGHAEAPAVAA